MLCALYNERSLLIGQLFLALQSNWSTNHFLSFDWSVIFSYMTSFFRLSIGPLGHMMPFYFRNMPI